MSIQSEITRISGNISDSLAAVEDMGGTVPSGATSNNLAAAIRTIAGSGGIYVGDDAPTDDKYLMWVETDEPLGTTPISRGGTGATTAAQARENLGVNVESIPVTYVIQPSRADRFAVNKFGELIIINISNVNFGASTSDRTVAQIPVEYAPKNINVFFTLYDRVAGVAVMYITPDGDIRVSKTSELLYGSGSYILGR